MRKLKDLLINEQFWVYDEKTNNLMEFTIIHSQPNELPNVITAKSFSVWSEIRFDVDAEIPCDIPNADWRIIIPCFPNYMFSLANAQADWIRRKYKLGKFDGMFMSVPIRRLAKNDIFFTADEGHIANMCRVIRVKDGIIYADVLNSTSNYTYEVATGEQRSRRTTKIVHTTPIPREYLKHWQPAIEYVEGLHFPNSAKNYAVNLEQSGYLRGLKAAATLAAYEASRTTSSTAANLYKTLAEDILIIKDRESEMMDNDNPK